MATLACRVQFLDDTDPFNSTNFPEPSRPPLFTFREDLALGTQLAGVHRLLRAPHKVRPGAAGWASRTRLRLWVALGGGGAAGGAWPPAPSSQERTSPLPVGQRGSRQPAAGAGSAGRARRTAPRSVPELGAGGAEQVPRRLEAGWKRFPGTAPLARPGGRGGARAPAVGPGTSAGAEPGAETPGSEGTQVPQRTVLNDARGKTSGLWGSSGRPRDTRDKARFPRDTSSSSHGGHRLGRGPGTVIVLGVARFSQEKQVALGPLEEQALWE